jgi:hypothetical protein
MAFRSIGPLVLLAVSIWCSATSSRLPAEEVSRPTTSAWPQPGEVYREYALHNGGNLHWRVTDPQATAEGAREFLPNPILNIDVDDLDGAVRAEALLDRWGGHLRTTNKRIRFNGNDWLTIPELTTTPDFSRAELYYSQDNPVIEVPLEHLREGTNSLEATCTTLANDAWGQWGLYSLILRIYYDPAQKLHPAGHIVQPADGATIGENPTIKIECSPDAARVDVLAWYEGFDEDGDGVFTGWHGSYQQPARGSPAELEHHVGTVTRAPWEVTWNTRWVPDQAPGSVKLRARIQNRGGVWFITAPVETLTLTRAGRVVLYRAADVPEGFGVRSGNTKSCAIRIPHHAPLAIATEAVLALRTWHGWDGHHEPLDLNGYRFAIGGKNHHYDFDLKPIPTSVLRPGANELLISSKTEHHMLEVLWPGPALLVRYAERDEHE